jgi:ABC-type uncharacterized transport system substrate-binding protein
LAKLRFDGDSGSDRLSTVLIPGPSMGLTDRMAGRIVGSAMDRAAQVGRRNFLRQSLTLASIGLLTGCRTPPRSEPRSSGRRIGFLGPTTAQNLVLSFQDGLRERGYVDGHDLVVEYRWADTTEGLRAATTELVQLGIEALVTAGGPATGEAWAVTKTVPIVGVNFPVPSPFAPSLSRGGTNVTGVIGNVVGLAGKRLDLLKQAVPSATRIAAFWTGDRTTPGGEVGQNGPARAWQETHEAAPALGVELLDLEVLSFSGSVDEILAVMFESAVRKGTQAAVVLPESRFEPYRSRIVQLAADNRLPAMYASRDFTVLGGLLTYTTSFTGLYRQAAEYVDRILRGTSVLDLPIEQPTTFDFVVNLVAARALGLIIPQVVLAQATEIIQ